VKSKYERRLFPVDPAADEKTFILHCQVRDAMDAFGWVKIYHFPSHKFLDVPAQEAVRLCRAGEASLEETLQPGNAAEDNQMIRERKLYRMNMGLRYVVRWDPESYLWPDPGGDI
jgi:hypothetical protein